MGVRVFETDAEPCAASSSCCSSCCNCTNSSATTATTTTMPPSSSKKQQQKKTTNAATTTNASKCKHSGDNSTPITTQHYKTTTTEYVDSRTAASNVLRTIKDFVGNAKEFRIEHNKNDLRIIGNNNRIRIGQNSGNIHIIGNNTRLKISTNDGQLQYTGNDGRICLGNESHQQTVNYIGCNGTLKLVNTAKLNAKFNEKCKTKCQAQQQQQQQQATHVTLSAGHAKVKVKSASYGGEGSKPEWQQLHELLQSKCKQQKTSMPNLTTDAECTCCRQHPPKEYLAKHCQITNNFNLVNNMGNILITNAVNVSV